MNTFTIDRNSTSFRYLSRWDSSYILLLEHGFSDFVAHDFCSYYRDVIKLIAFQLFILMFIPATVYFNINVWLFHHLPDVQSFNLIWQIPFVFMGFFATLLVGAWVCSMIFYGVITSINKFIIKPILNLIPKKNKVKNTDKNPGFIKTWYEGFKGNYCPTIKYDDTLIQRSTTEEE